MKTRRKSLRKKGASKTEKNENTEDMKLEQTKKKKAIQDMLGWGMSPLKSFRKIRCVCLDQTSIAE